RRELSSGLRNWRSSSKLWDVPRRTRPSWERMCLERKLTSGGRMLS
ncbi:hypothetical protein A2U01_0110726, partial [Trifolium medium]|nr:hypothetical protein [Trifolium medium]